MIMQITISDNKHTWIEIFREANADYHNRITAIKRSKKLSEEQHGELSEIFDRFKPILIKYQVKVYGREFIKINNTNYVKPFERIFINEMMYKEWYKKHISKSANAKAYTCIAGYKIISFDCTRKVIAK
jgi:hypothetical protein